MLRDIPDSKHCSESETVIWKSSVTKCSNWRLDVIYSCIMIIIVAGYKGYLIDVLFIDLNFDVNFYLEKRQRH